MFDWDDLKVFLIAYRHGSIGRAAEILGVSGSTVSRRLAALEDALGQSLFVRSPDGLKPTDAAHKAWSAAEQAERSMTCLQNVVGAHDEPRGNVRVSMSSEVLHNVVLPRWSEFSRAYPEITVEFLESPLVTDLERWEADIAVRTVRPSTEESLVITRLRDTSSALFGARQLLLARDVDPDDPHALSLVEESGWSEWPWIDWAEPLHHLGFAQARQQYYPRARIVLRLENLNSMRLAASAGVGLVFLPYFFGRISPNLVPLPSTLPTTAYPVYMVSHTAIRHTARVDAVWKHLDRLLRGKDHEQIDMAREALTAAYGVTFARPSSVP